MDRSSVATLVKKAHTRDEYKIDRVITSERDVFCDITSVSAAEWFEGGRNGLNPEMRLTMFKYDYDGEDVAKVGGTEYTIYRTYDRRNDFIELYLSKREGNANIE